MANLSSFDLNLLRVFDEVMAERSLTRAARNLSLTQPAVSNRATITALDVVRVQVWAKTPEGTYGDVLLPPTPLAKDASVSFPKSGPVYIFASAQENIRINYGGQQFTPSSAPNNIRGALAIELP